MSSYPTSEFGTEGPLGDAHLDEKSQWLADLLKSGKVRRLAKEWGVRKEVWQRFWDRLFEESDYAKPRWRKGQVVTHPYRPPKGASTYLNPEHLHWATREGCLKNAPPMLMEFDGSYWERHHELKRIARAVGPESYLQALNELDEASPFRKRAQALQRICIEKLMGVDVYWKGQVEDTPATKDSEGMWYRKQKPSSSKSGWGTLTVFPFPFTAVFRYDDSPEHLILTAAPVVNRIRRFPKQGLEELEAFVRANLEPSVLEVRNIRLMMRSMDDQEIRLSVVYGNRREIRGVFHIENVWNETDVWRNPRTTEVVNLSPGFRWNVTTDKRAPSQGFKCINFVCGEPEVHVHPDNFVKQADKLENLDDQGPQQLSRDALGIRLDYFDGDDEIIRALVEEDGNVDPVLVDYVRKLYQAYREEFVDDSAHKVQTLSNSFWYTVYNNDATTPDELTRTLLKEEGAESLLVRDLVHGTTKRTHSHLLQDLFHRLAYFDGSMRACCWYTFWHAVALNNRGMGYRLIPRAVAKQLDPAEPGSPLAKVLSRAELAHVLQQAGLYEPDDPSSTIDDDLIAALYRKLDEVEGQTMKDFSAKWRKNVEEAKVVLSHSTRALARGRTMDSLAASTAAGATAAGGDAGGDSDEDAADTHPLRNEHEGDRLAPPPPEGKPTSDASARICREACALM